ncbi:hypothetical protein L6164_028553 [Bauhinia variegata]|uniref:Uncharacterized protein n=1 Tax=Bauhinia variegata TaxID=167791 RepID=A0ACB9L6U5_BAUVA|nr:hypothetical protein L6164_028553 [Bauhinia variegata]
MQLPPSSPSLATPSQSQPRFTTNLNNQKLLTKLAEDVQNRNLSEFKNEVSTLSKTEHLNLLRLYGYLENQDEKIIIVEYVANGTLWEHLDDMYCRKKCIRGDELEMGERLDVAIDVAHAVTYLHMYADHQIIHRDIKASNFLITEKLRGKVADFGLACLAEEVHAATHISTH